MAVSCTCNIRLTETYYRKTQIEAFMVLVYITVTTKIHKYAHNNFTYNPMYVVVHNFTYVCAV